MVKAPALPKTRSEAIELGERFYYPDEPCKHGHHSKRYTLNTRCWQCSQQKYKAEKQAFEEARKKKIASMRRDDIPAAKESA